MADRGRIVSAILGVVGGVIGGTLGYLGFGWAYRHGFYAMILPGGLLGLGCGLPSRYPSLVRGVVCGVAGLLLGLYSEWQYFQSQTYPSFTAFLPHVHKLDGFSMTMIVLGG